MGSGIDSDWFDQRLQALGFNRARLANMMGVHRSIVTRMLKGQREISPAEASELATYLQAPYDEVIRRLGVNVPRDDRQVSPIVGLVDDRGQVITKTVPAPRRADRPPGAGDDVAGLRIDTPGSWLDGAVLYYGQAVTVEPEAVGRLAVVETRDGSKYARVLKHGNARGKWRTVNLAGDSDNRDIDLKWATPVLWIRL